MKKEKVVENYFASNLYSNQEIMQSIENTKKEFANKIVNVDINLNEFGVYVVTYYFKTKENLFNRIMVKLKRKFKKSKTALLQQSTQQNVQQSKYQSTQQKNTHQSRRQGRQQHIQQSRLEKYTGNQYGKYKETKTFKPY